MSDMVFQKKNTNPRGQKQPDCVIRAIAEATKQDWYKVYDSLCEVGRFHASTPTSKEVYQGYLYLQGWTKQRMPRFPDNTRYTVREFADAYPRGTFIISIANHLTCVVDSTLIDAWDCSHKSVGNYWIKK